MKFVAGVALSTLLCWNAQAGTITAVGTRAALAGNDSLEWGTAADDATFPTTPIARTTAGLLPITATIGAPGFAIWQQGGGSFTFAGNFAPGDVVLDTFLENGPVSIEFSSAIRGVGFQIQHSTTTLTGTVFTATLEFFGAGNVSFGTVVRTDGLASYANDDSAIFLGGTSSLRDIVRVEVSVNEVGGNRAFAINRLSLLTTDPPVDTGVPEPASVTLVGTGLAVCVWLSRRR